MQVTAPMTNPTAPLREAVTYLAPPLSTKRAKLSQRRSTVGAMTARARGTLKSNWRYMARCEALPKVPVALDTAPSSSSITNSNSRVTVMFAACSSDSRLWPRA
jgi:hypothetical protein